MSTSGRTTREIIIKLKVEPDSGNARVFETAADLAKKAYQDSAYGSMQAMQQQRDEANRSVSVMLDAYEQYHQKLLILDEAGGYFRKSLGDISVGATRAARGLVLMGVASEENMENAVRTLARFQGTVDVLRGSFRTVQGLINLWDSYRTMVQAATAAQLALNAAQGVSTAGAVRQAAARSTSGIAAGLAGTAGGIAGGTMGGNAAVSALTALGPVTLGVTAAFAGLLAVSPGFREAVLELIGWTDKAADAQKQHEETIRLAQEAMSKRAQEERYASDLARTEMRFHASRYDIQQRFAALQDQYDPINGPSGRQQRLANERLRDARVNLNELSVNDPAYWEKAIGFRRELVAAEQELQRVRIHTNELERDANEEKVRTTEETINLLRSEREQLLSEAERMQKKQDRAKQNLAEMDPTKRASAQRIIEKAQRGEPLHPDELAFARKIGLTLTDNLVKKDVDEKIDQDPFTRNLISKDQQLVDAKLAEAKAVDVQIASHNEIKIQLEQNIEDLAKKLINELRPIVADQIAALSREMQAESRKLREEQRRLQQKQSLREQSRRNTGGR